MKNIIFSFALLAFLLIGSYDANAQIIVKIKPRAPKVVVVHKKHRPNYIWVEGHWKVNRYGKYVWVEGHWVKKRHGYVWVNGHWKKVRSGWIWVPGHWKAV